MSFERGWGKEAVGLHLGDLRWRRGDNEWHFLALYSGVLPSGAGGIIYDVCS